MTTNLMTSDTLHSMLGDPNLRVLDASWYLPAMGRNAQAEYRTAHVPGAVRFDVDAASDPASGYPHTLPEADAFARYVGGLGVGNDSTVVVYDGAGLFSAARAWWMFKVFGHDRVFVLDGGFPQWTRDRWPTEAGEAAVTPCRYEARLQSGLVARTDDVAAALADGSATVVDVRAADRFRGEAPEPRAGVRAGHMPGAVNLPYATLLEEGRLRSPDALRASLSDAGARGGRPVITSCGSGVSAAILTLAMAESGLGMNRLYDGSWAEWGSRPDCPVETG